MPQPNKIPLPFAASGDKNLIPESTETTGLASWREGFPAITSAPFSEGGVAPKRADFNGIFNALSQAVMWMQQGGVYAYDADTDYEAGNVVLDAGGLYVANTANGPSSAVVQPSSDTTGATWKPVRLDLATQIAAGYMSANDKKLVDSIPELGAFNKMFFSQTSGSFVAPRTGVYRITLKGGGGGGGHPSNSSQLGGGGGEGGEICFYVTLIKNIDYAYSIGAGGAAGSNGSPATTGGNSQIVVDGTTYSVSGGGYGRNTSITTFSGGRGGYTFAPSPLTDGYFTPGQSGAPGGSSNEYRKYSMGGGCSDTDFGTALYGAGGRGAGGSLTASAGGDGFILIEYAG